MSLRITSEFSPAVYLTLDCHYFSMVEQAHMSSHNPSKQSLIDTRASMSRFSLRPRSTRRYVITRGWTTWASEARTLAWRDTSTPSAASGAMQGPCPLRGDVSIQLGSLVCWSGKYQLNFERVCIMA